jgi:RimJ/RimL family protein N-acetyltransferase
MELTEGNLRLRPLRYADRERLAELANNKNIWNTLRDMFPLPYTVDDADRFVDMVKQQEPQITFAIELDFEFVGVIGLVLQPDVYRKSAEIGYWIGEPYWGKGITTRALALAMEYAFETMKLERLFAGIFEGNEASKKVLEKCGFMLEGISRKAVYKNNRLMDEWRFGKLRSEWNNNF